MEILELITKAIPEPRKHVSAYAPHIITIKIDPEKKGELIGPGGRTINKIIDMTGAEIDIEEDGTIFITGKDMESTEKAKKLVEEITYVPQVGDIFQGKITRVFEFGAMAEISPKREGLIHVSELAPFHVAKVTDILKVGDVVPVKLIQIDQMGRFNLSLKQADPNYANGKKQQPREQRPRQ